MRRSDRLRRALCALAVLTTVAVTQAPAGGEPDDPGGGGGGPLPAGGATVTLVTGDRVTLGAHGGGSGTMPLIEPGEGRTGVLFDVQQIDGHVQVVPSDAAALVGSGRLDPRLFDVTALVNSGYDDAHRSDIPMIVTGADAGFGEAAADARTGGPEVTPLPAADAVGIAQPKDGTADFWSELVASPEASSEAGTGDDSGDRRAAGDVGKVWLDGLRQPSLDVSVPQIGAPQAWEAGYTGAGVEVAVLDSGIDAAHPDLAGKVTARANFTDDPDADTEGHGTHVASTIAGSGAASGGRFKGVAPDATLLDGKVCGSFGCPESAIVAGMQWAVDNGARVVSLSLGGADTPDTDPLEAALDRLSAESPTLFVVAAGNDGPAPATVSSPASATAALAVGAVDDADQVADFSARGPRVGDGALVPDLTAPGVGIVAARSSDGWMGDPVDAHYTSMSGTSMATPHVAGAAALLAQQHTDWDGDQLQATLVGASRPTAATDVFAQGAGRVDVARAIQQDVIASPEVVSAGRASWPHTDDEPSTHTVTYRNPGAEPVSLSLTAPTAGPDGQPAPAGMFSLSADQVDVPAGGEASVEVTVDTTVVAPDGPGGGYGAWITATSGDVVVTTPVAVDAEAESYELTIEVRDATGALTPEYSALLMSLEPHPTFTDLYDADGTAIVRLPRGSYHLGGSVGTPPDDDARWTAATIVQPELELTGDTTVVLDAREAEPIDVRVTNPEAEPQFTTLAYTRTFGDTQLVSSSSSFQEDPALSSAQIGPAVAPDAMVTYLDASWAVPDADGGTQRSPRTYELGWHQPGRMIDGATHVVADAELAATHLDLRTTGSDRYGLRFLARRFPGIDGWHSHGSVTALPVRRTELVNTDGGVEWAGGLEEVREDDVFGEPDGALRAGFGRRRVGHPARERWNQGPLGPMVDRRPSYACGTEDGEPSSRSGDVIRIDVPMLSDADDHPGCGGYVDGRTSLSRDGVEIGWTDVTGGGSFTVPAARGTYRLEVDAPRAQTTALSTHVNAVWTFRSAHVGGTAAKELALMAVRFRPELDDRNQAPAGRRFDLPFEVEAIGGAGRQLQRPVVEVSYDDGASWAPARVTAKGGNNYSARLHHPASGEVSLRATVTDGAGNKVVQTIVRAYHLAS